MELRKKTREKAVLYACRAKLAAAKLVYGASGGRLAKKTFLRSVPPVNEGTDVRVLERTEDSVTIAKTDAAGNILDVPFRVMSTTDLHFGDTPENRDKTMLMLRRHIHAAKPDLVIFTGDVIDSKHRYYDCVQFAEFFEETGIYWAFVFGNHEAPGPLNGLKELMFACKTAYPHCLTLFGPKELFGAGNFRIDVLSAPDRLNKSLFLMDSGSNPRPWFSGAFGSPEGLGGYDFIKPSQIEWYERGIAALRERYGAVTSFLYIHIPLPEFGEVMEEDGEGGFRVKKDVCEYVDGGCWESCGCARYNSGMFDAILRLGSTKAVFAGHDHANDFHVVYKGVHLVYNRYCGYDTYSLGSMFGMPERLWLQGVTVTDCLPGPDFEISARMNSMYI